MALPALLWMENNTTDHALNMDKLSQEDDGELALNTSKININQQQQILGLSGQDYIHIVNKVINVHFLIVWENSFRIVIL